VRLWRCVLCFALSVVILLRFRYRLGGFLGEGMCGFLEEKRRADRSWGGASGAPISGRFSKRGAEEWGLRLRVGSRRRLHTVGAGMCGALGLVGWGGLEGVPGPGPDGRETCGVRREACGVLAWDAEFVPLRVGRRGVRRQAGLEACCAGVVLC
jgi:hypothetical protein